MSNVSIGGGGGSITTPVTVPDGGTGVTSVTAYAVICGGTTATSAFQSAGTGLTGQLLTSQGAAALPIWTTVAGTGDVTAAAALVDNSLIRGDGGAKGIQDSGILIDDTDNISGVSAIGFDNLSFNTSPTPLTAEGSVYWDATDHGIAVKNDEVDITLQLGQEAIIRVYNDTGVTITNGSVVYASGAEVVEGRLTIALADASAAATSSVIGLATHDIETATFGYVAQFGNVNNLNTSAFSAGDPVYLSTTAGQISGTSPTSPNFSVFLGYVSIVNATTGRIFVTTIGNTSGAVVSGTSESLVLSCRKGSAGTIARGLPVYISGYNVGADEFEVELADANGVNTYPCAGLADASITNSASGNVVLAGRINDIDTSSYSVTDSLYLSETVGTLTNVRPTATTSQVQRIGTVARSNVSNGVILVQGAGRVNDVPNASSGMTYDLSSNTLTGTYSEFNTACSDESFAKLSANTFTGVQDFGGATSLEIPNGATPTVDAAGEIAMDTTVTDWSPGLMKVYGNEECGVVMMPIAQFTSPTDNHVVTYNATTDEFELQAGGGSMPEVVMGGSAASHGVNTTTAFAPVSYRDFGSIEMLVRSFDDTGPEYMQGSFRVPADLGAGASSVTFEIVGSAATAAASKNVKFTFDFVQVADSGLMTGAYGSAEVWDDQAISATQDDQDIISNTETITNLGWVAGREIYYRLYRSAATTTNLSGDYDVIAFNIRIPQA